VPCSSRRTGIVSMLCCSNMATPASRRAGMPPYVTFFEDSTAMTMPTLAREQVRQLDKLAMTEYGMSGLVLMENAGRGTTDVL